MLKKCFVMIAVFSLVVLAACSIPDKPVQKTDAVSNAGSEVGAHPEVQSVGDAVEDAAAADEELNVDEADGALADMGDALDEW